MDDKNGSFLSPGCVSLMTVEEKHNRNFIWTSQAIRQASPQTSPQASPQASLPGQLRKLYLRKFRTLEVLSVN